MYLTENPILYELLEIEPARIYTATLSNSSNAEYYTSADVATYNSAYNSSLSDLAIIKNSQPNLYANIITQYGSESAAAQYSALNATGFTEVPVEGATRSDYVAPVDPDPDPDPDPEPAPEVGGSGDGTINEDLYVEGGESTMEGLSTLLTDFGTVIDFTTTSVMSIGSLYTSVPILFICIGIPVFGKLVKFFKRMIF